MTMNKKGKICFVVQRYGLEVNGGAELECRQYAERLTDDYDVHVFTTKAIDYMTWRDEYTADHEVINGVEVWRFPVAFPRDVDEFNKVNAKLLSGNTLSPQEEQEWLIKQGPYAPALIEAVKQHKDEYLSYIFCTYLYYPTVAGVEAVREKAITVPTAHDEIYLTMKMFRKVFTDPKGIFYNTIEEKEFAEERFENSDVMSEIGGVGVDIPQDVNSDRFRQKYNVDKYVVYVGRIDEGKGCGRLFHYFQEYKKRNGGSLKLVLMGKAVIPVLESDDIINLGFVSDQDKFDGMAGAQFLIMSSEFESLSMVVLESLALKVPVLVNGRCKVLKGHCVRSNAGLYYHDYYEFEGAVNYMMSHDEERQCMGENGVTYIANNYQWKDIIGRLENLIDYVPKE